MIAEIPKIGRRRAAARHAARLAIGTRTHSVQRTRRRQRPPNQVVLCWLERQLGLEM